MTREKISQLGRVRDPQMVIERAYLAQLEAIAKAAAEYLASQDAAREAQSVFQQHASCWWAEPAVIERVAEERRRARAGRRTARRALKAALKGATG